MKDIFLVYNTSCFYEIIILNYFLSVSNCDMIFCSLDGQAIKTMEGFSINVDMSLTDIDKEQIRSFIVPGGYISVIDHEEVHTYLQDLNGRGVIIGGICAGVDVLEHAGILQDVKSTHSTDEDTVSDKNIITARANGYVDFAIEVAKKLDLFVSEEDLQETVDFWKNHKRISEGDRVNEDHN